MKQRAIMALLSLTILLTLSSCTSCIHKVRDLLLPKAKPVTFETYDKELKYSYMGETKIEMKLRVDMPIGGGQQQQQNITKGIREIIKKSNIAKQFGTPKEGTLTEVMEDYAERLQQSGSVEDYMDLSLSISNVYQNEECAVFEVCESGINSGSRRLFDAVIRLSDGHWMTLEEMLNISNDILMALFKKHSDESFTEDIRLEGNDFCVSPEEGGCLLSADNGNMMVTVPLEDLEPYFTDEGRELFHANPMVEEMVDEAILKANPVKGELGRYNLRGPVKSVDLSVPELPEFPWIVTFDRNGIMTSDMGIVPNEREIVRDAQGRATRDGAVEYTYDEEGKLVKSDFREGRHSSNLTIRYYNRYGAIVKENSVFSISAGRAFAHGTSRYSNFKYDAHGNWIERKSSDKTEKRTITYYK